MQIGPLDYNIYTNSQLRTVDEIDQLPIKMVGESPVRVADIGYAEDGHQIQTNIVRVDGQRSVYMPVLKQGGDTNTIAVVDGVKDALQHLFDVPKQLVTKRGVRSVRLRQDRHRDAAARRRHRPVPDLVMILIFLGSMRATVAVFFSIPLSALATFIALSLGGSSINSMVLGGLALAFSRLIDNSVVVLENIYRHLELGESPAVAAEKGGREVALPVLAATLTTVVVFFPVTFLYGVSKFLFSALALAVVLSLFASYAVAMTVVPLFCARFIKAPAHHGTPSAEAPVTVDQPHRRWSLGDRFNVWFNTGFEAFLQASTTGWSAASCAGPWLTLVAFGVHLRRQPGAVSAARPLLLPAHRRRPVRDQPQGSLRHAPRGHRKRSRQGREPGAPDRVARRSRHDRLQHRRHARFLGDLHHQLRHAHRVRAGQPEGRSQDRQLRIHGARQRRGWRRELPELSAYFQSGGLVDAVLNLGLPAPIDVQVAGSNMDACLRHRAASLRAQIREIPGVADVFIPQDIDYPALQLDVDRTRASELGLDQQEVVDNVITALTSNQMIAPSFWIDPKTGNDYMLTVQYPENQVKSLADLRAIPLRAPSASGLHAARHDQRMSSRIKSPTEVDHYQLRRTIDIYVRRSKRTWAASPTAIDGIIAQTKVPEGLSVTLRGMVQGMRASFSQLRARPLLSPWCCST